MLTDLRGLERRCPTRRGPRGLIRAGSETGAPIREDRLISVLRRSAFGFQMAWVVWLFGTGPAVRGAESPAPSDSVPAPLTSVQQVLALGARTAGQCFVPARLEGLITYADAAAQIIYVQDASGGIRVVYTNASHLPVSGQLVVVEGTATAGIFAPFIDCANVTVTGTAAVPEPCEACAARMAAGESFGQWVQVEGVVRDVAKEPEGALLFVSSGGQRFHAVIRPFPGSALPADWLDARVALRGVCWTEVDTEDKPTGFTLYVPGTNWLSVLERGPQDIFRQPAIPIKSNPELCRQSDTRVKVAGTVAFHSLSGYVYLQDEDSAVCARLLVPLARANPHASYADRPPVVPLRPGERIELVGAPTAATFAPLLQDAEFRRFGDGPPPASASVSAGELYTGRFDHRLVSLRARVLASEIRQTGPLKHQLLALQSGDTIFEALWQFTGTNNLSAPAKNSYVQAGGICEVQVGELNRIQSFRLLLRQPADLCLLGRPPWWEPFPAGKILAAILGLGGVAAVWIWLLRRQVSQRTVQLQAEIAERQRAQTELRHALAAERELSEFRSRFVSMVSHEFRTPLGVILSAAENLDSYFERLKPEQRRAQLDHVIQATRQMGKVMENVLLLSRAEAGKLEFKPAALDLAGFCQGLASQVQSSAESKCPIRFRAGPLPPARGDENLMRHIFLNLLTNAVKYSQQAAPIEFTVERQNGAAVFRVQDSGIGIPGADQKQLFSAFHRGRNAAQVPGTGLGLVIVKRCVELHGGRVICESEEGRGTTFTVTLPLFPA